MTHSIDQMQIAQVSYDPCSNSRPIYARQHSSKRHISDNDNQNNISDNSCKRGRNSHDDSITCPIAKFGCLREIPSHDLQEHYSSKIHQECLLKAVESYVQQLYSEPKTSLTLSNNEENYSDIMDSVDMLAEGLSSLNDDNVRINYNVMQLHNNTLEQQNQIEQLKNSVAETSQFMHATQMNTNILQTEIESLRQMVMDLTSQSSHDGTFIWKITDIAKKINDSISERQTSVYSPPFYSSPTGYKMCMRLYFNGDGQARRTHLSLFFVLMRGDYDAVLAWPFSYKITFCLYDQTNNQKHIIDSFRPDIKSNSFQRPKSNMNIASGLPKFVPLAAIQQENNPYVRDDCMFIRCIVDFVSTPKEMIPYICSLNMGLPKTVQQTMIRTEIERRNLVTSTLSNSENDSMKKDSLH
ncbi:unnamed protein product [Rotaria sp. Silwood2]|nr:unnamed protein product [Rotaria sp. Silwood2]CAF2486181.1 unnamed protein product [Rotaria sp. Silwood2]CAF2869733.1 unnamed protein product [Rotaria sp. Silwood2]CAF4033964.1 unnamed protein product [Rotaria sp. Silwood2]CAF4478693.1 unnamed protein product [Rotaria sp. Silwood2]